jgi:hypothetical protein
VRRLLFVAIITTASAGCIDGFRGSLVEIELSGEMPVQANYSTLIPGAGELANAGHFRIHAIQNLDGRAAVFEVGRFEIHRVVDLESPCLIDVGDEVPFPGIHITRFGDAMQAKTGIADVANPPADASETDKIDAATAQTRMSNLALLTGGEGLKVLGSASPNRYPNVDASCTGTGLPPPECTEPEANARRLAVCNTSWGKDRDLWEGTDTILSTPLNGLSFGFVVGSNPLAVGVPVGGAGIYVNAALDDVDEIAISFFLDEGDDEGSVILAGGLRASASRGVRYAHLESVLSPGLSAEVAVFADLGEDEVHF